MLTKFFHRILRAPEVRKEHRNEKEEREIEAGEGGGEEDDDVFFS